MERVTRERRVDGILYVSLPMDNSYAEKLSQAALPTVLVDNYHEALDSIIVENEKGAYTATNHLIQLGHQRIAIINGNLRSLPAVERLKGYRHALEANKITLDENLIIICDSSKGEDGFNEDAGYFAMKELLSRDKCPTAVFISSDIQAIGAIRAIQEAGLTIPDDIAIVGFDDIQFSRFLGLTTIHQPINDLGNMAVHRLMDQLNGKNGTHFQQKLETKLVIRKSCGASLKKNKIDLQ